MQDIDSLRSKLRTFIMRQRTQALEMLETLVRINSDTMNFRGVKQVASLVETQLNLLGFKTSWVPLIKSVNRAGHLFAQHLGKKRKHLLLIGHLDTVFSQAEAFQKFNHSESCLYGAGIIDNKGGIIVMLYALKALESLGILQELRLTVALMGDEENTGIPFRKSRASLIQGAKQCDVALGFEPGGARHTAIVSRRGIVYWRLEIEAKTGHSAKIFAPQQGHGAIFEAARILHAFEKQLKPEIGLTLNPGLMAGGETIKFDTWGNFTEAIGKRNVIVPKAIIEGEFRFLSQQQFEQTCAHMQHIVNQASQHCQGVLNFTEPKPAMAVKPSNQALLKQFSEVSQALGLGSVAMDMTERGSADINYVAAQLPCLDGLGPYGRDMHTTKESLDVEALIVAIQRVAGFIYSLTN